MVKADGYGHGAVECAAAALAGGASWLAVAAARGGGGAARRAARCAASSTLGALTPAELDLALEADADVAAWRPGFLERGRRARPRRRDAGRASTSSTTAGWAASASATRGRSLALLDAGRRRRAARARRALDPLRHRRRARLDLLRRAARALRARWPSARCAAHPDSSCTRPTAPRRCASRASHFDMVRCGVAIYGLDPFGERPGRARARAGARAALLRRRRQALRAPATSAGYGRTLARAERDTSVGVLPIGYGDGVRRALSNNAEVLVGGRRYPLVGTVSMDNITVDLGPSRRSSRAPRRC